MSLTENDNCQEKPIVTEGEPKSYLFAFDFDHTVVNDNSDCVITSLANSPVPAEVKKFYDGTNWTEYMNKIFWFLHEEGVTTNDICRLVRNMEGTRGIVPLLKTLVSRKESSSNPSIHLMIISDANDLFISEFLRAQVLDSPNLNDTASIKEQLRQLPFDIITNKVVKNSTSNLPVGLMNNNSSTPTPLQISPYENQSSCKICPKNLCKGSALQKYIKEKGPFTRIFYTGDGGNDICPALKLNQSDYVFVRMNFGMHKRLMKSDNGLGIGANVIIWEDGGEVKKVIEDVLQEL